MPDRRCPPSFAYWEPPARFRPLPIAPLGETRSAQAPDMAESGLAALAPRTVRTDRIFSPIETAPEQLSTNELHPDVPHWGLQSVAYDAFGT
jgi:hypothetical protein